MPCNLEMLRGARRDHVKKTLSDADFDLAERMRREGYSTDIVRQRIGVSWTTLKNAAAKAGRTLS